jgi:uncharacterized protein (UPF0264 family)
VLLASVADAGEAATALRARVGIVDLKDTRRGPLGACRPDVWRAAASLRDGIAPDTPLSAALGEVRSIRDAGQAAARATIAAGFGIDFVKVAISGAMSPVEASGAIATIVAAASTTPLAYRRDGRVRSVPPRLIVAAYADAAPGAVPPRDLPRVASVAGAAGCLIDTAIKDGRSLGDHLGLAQAARFVAECHQRGLIAALAGSISVADLPELVALRPDILGARGALCRGGREGRLDRGRLILFHDALRVARRSTRSVPRPAGPPPGPAPDLALWRPPRGRGSPSSVRR